MKKANSIGSILFLGLLAKLNEKNFEASA